MSRSLPPRVSAAARLFKSELAIVLTLCESIGSVRCLTVKLLIEHGEWDQLINLDFDPSRYSDHRLLADDYLISRILSKCERVPTSIDRKAVALSGFRAAEDVCKESNARIRSWLDGVASCDPDVARAVFYTQRHIAKILGPLTRPKLDFVERMCRFGPGATTSLSGVVTLGKKFSRREINTTSRLLPFRTFCFPLMWKETCRLISVRESSKVVTVPKTAKTDRTICIEPDLNIFVQLGIGALLRERLRGYGLNLNTQRKNQELARLGSISDHLCTMDLSQASDLICRETVWSLLPYDWADLLHFARVDKYALDGQESVFHKWSSMGNGYTFELESLIFYGVLLGVGEELGFSEDFVAYGDDLIFPSEWLDLVQRTLEFLGFKVNSLKTFGKGYFRESCGTDWFHGREVRPIFLKGEPIDFESKMYSYANALVRWARRRNDGWSRDSRVLPAWLRCFTAVDRRDRHRIPDGFGDVGFVSSWDEASPSNSYSTCGWSGFTFRYRRVPPRLAVVDSLGAYISALQKSTSFTNGREALRGRFLHATTRRGHTLVWPELGPWL